MKLGLLGDIHGNADALKAVLIAAKALEVEQLLVTGDLVGYYFEPGAVLEMLRLWPTQVVRGNHEAMLEAAREDFRFLEKIKRKYGTGVELALKQLTSEQLDDLCKLPDTRVLNVDNCRILLCHGSPSSIDQYVYRDAPKSVLEGCSVKGADIVIMGHTHYQMDLIVDQTRLVNPGSVGQPRDGRPGAQWAVLDTATHNIEFRLEAYSCEHLLGQCRIRHPELPYLASILERRK